MLTLFHRNQTTLLTLINIWSNNWKWFPSQPVEVKLITVAAYLQTHNFTIYNIMSTFSHYCLFSPFILWPRSHISLSVLLFRMYTWNSFHISRCNETPVLCFYLIITLNYHLLIKLHILSKSLYWKYDIWKIICGI